MLHAKKDPGLLVRNKVIVTEEKKKNPQTKRKKKPNKSDKITNAQLTTVLYLHC